MIQHDEEMNETRDLDDNDLEAVTGGIDGADGGCIPTPWKKKDSLDPTL